MTLIFNHSLARVKVNPPAKYQGQRHEGSSILNGMNSFSDLNKQLGLGLGQLLTLFGGIFDRKVETKVPLFS